MIFERRDLLISLLQLALASTLLILLHQQWTGAPTATPERQPAPPPQLQFERIELATITATDDSQLARIEARPLFIKGRKPVASRSEVIAAHSGADLSDWRLSGVIASGDLAIAIFFNAESESKALKPGMQLDGWTLTRVESNRVELQLGGRVIELQLRDDTQES